MKLLIISHTPHWRKEGQWQGWAATVQENIALSQLFTHIHIIGIKQSSPAPQNLAPYPVKNFQLSLLPPAGGDTWFSRILSLPLYIYYTFYLLLKIAFWKRENWIFVRAPANIAFIGQMIIVLLGKKNSWCKYAGNWATVPEESRVYTTQKYTLRKFWLPRIITVNNKIKEDPSSVHSFKNPVLWEKELITLLASPTYPAYRNASTPSKQSDNNARHTSSSQYTPLVIKALFVGRIEKEKGVFTLLEILKLWQQVSLQTKEGSTKNTASPITSLPTIHLTVVGEGKDLEHWKSEIVKNQLDSFVFWKGSISREKLPDIYKENDFFLFPTQACEGWPKVLTEAILYGLIPLTTPLAGIPETLQSLNCGIMLSPQPRDWVEGLSKAWKNYDAEFQKVLKAHKYMSEYTYEAFAQKISSILKLAPLQNP